MPDAAGQQTETEYLDALLNQLSLDSDNHNEIMEEVEAIRDVAKGWPKHMVGGPLISKVWQPS